MGKNTKLLLFIIGFHILMVFVCFVLPDLPTEIEQLFLTLWMVGVIAAGLFLSKKTKQMSSKKTRYPGIRDRHLDEISMCKKEYRPLREHTEKYKQYIEELGLNTQHNIQLDLGDNPDTIYILQKGSNIPNVSGYKQKLLFCIEYLEKREMVHWTVLNLAKEIEDDYYVDYELKEHSMMVAMDISLIDMDFFDADKMIFISPKTQKPYLEIEINEDSLKLLYDRL